MDFGISFGALYAPTKRVVQLAEEAERKGFKYIWIPDSPMIYRDVYVNLALIADKTKSVKLGTLVTNPITRHPSVIASAALTLNEISGGRMIIGLGAGDSSVRRIGLQPAKVKQVAEAIQTIRRLCIGEALAENVKFGIRYAGTRIPIYVVATGRRMLKLGGALGDGIILHSGTSDTLLNFALKAVTQGVVERAQDMDALELAHMGFCAIDEDRSVAYALAKPSVIWFLVNYSEQLREAGLPLDDELARKAEEFRSNYASYDFVHSGEWEKAMETTKFLPDRFAEELAYTGTPEDVVRKIRKLEAKGFKQVIIRPPSTEHWERIFSLFIEHVLSKFT